MNERKILSGIVPIFSLLILICGVLLVAKAPSLTGKTIGYSTQKQECIEISNQKQIAIESKDQCCTEMRETTCIRLDAVLNLAYKSENGDTEYAATYLCYNGGKIYVNDPTMVYCQSKYNIDLK